MQETDLVQRADRIVTTLAGLHEPIAVANHLLSALSLAYYMSPQQIQRLSAAMYGKSELFRFLASYECIEAQQVVQLRVLYFILQSPVTCSDFVISNVLFVENLIKQIQPELGPKVIQIEAESPTFGSFFNDAEPLPFSGFYGCTQLVDAKVAVLEVISRSSAQGRMILLKNEDQLLSVLKGFSVLELFAPMRILGVLQVIMHLLLLEGCSKCDLYAEGLRSAARKIFFGNRHSLDDLARITAGKPIERAESMIFSKNGRVLFKSEELYQAKAVLLTAYQKLLEVKNQQE